jgi:hypothetical protein
MQPESGRSTSDDSRSATRLHWFSNTVLSSSTKRVLAFTEHLLTL